MPQNKLTLVGEAPSKLGTGQPFTGPSGDRLQQLLGLTSYEQLADHVEMVNIFENVYSPTWDAFGRKLARQRAITLLTQWHGQGPRDVVLCGRKVARAFGVEIEAWFRSERRGLLTLWTFPHPSGLNHFWNLPEDEQQASEFLRRLGSAACTHHPSEQCPLAHG